MTRCDRGPESTPAGAEDAMSGSSARWQSREAGPRRMRALARASRVSPGVESIEGVPGHRRRAPFTRVESGVTLGRTGPRQRATRTSGENGEATGASEAGRASMAIGEENAPMSARANRRSVVCAVKREAPRCHGFRPDVLGSRTSGGCPRLERVDGIHRPHASLAEVASTIERSLASR